MLELNSTDEKWKKLSVPNDINEFTNNNKK